MKRRVALVSAVVMMLGACGSSSSELEVTDATITQIIQPAYERALRDLHILNDHVAEELCVAPSAEALDEGRALWHTANRSWTFLGPMSFGPVTDNRTNTWVSYKSTDPEKIEALVTSGQEVDAEYIFDVAASTQRGLGAAEHFLFQTADDLQEPERCAYLNAVLQVAVEQATIAHDQWIVEATYVEMLREDPHMAVTEMVQGLAFSVAKLTQTTLTLATATNLTVDEVEEGPAQTGVRDLITELAAMQEIYLGSGQDPALSDLVNSRSAALDRSLRDRFPQCLEALDLLDTSRLAGIADQDIGLDAFQCLDGLRVLIESDVTSQLDVTLGFSDTDGDSG